MPLVRSCFHYNVMSEHLAARLLFTHWVFFFLFIYFFYVAAFNLKESFIPLSAARECAQVSAGNTANESCNSTLFFPDESHMTSRCFLVDSVVASQHGGPGFESKGPEIVSACTVQKHARLSRLKAPNYPHVRVCVFPASAMWRYALCTPPLRTKQ